MFLLYPHQYFNSQLSKFSLYIPPDFPQHFTPRFEGFLTKEMASSKPTIISICFIVLLTFSNVGILEGRSFQKGIDSMEILRGILVQYPKIERNGRRVMIDITREAPEGPSPQHHH